VRWGLRSKADGATVDVGGTNGKSLAWFGLVGSNLPLYLIPEVRFRETVRGGVLTRLTSNLAL
jgi:hypothetical protein